MEQKSAKSFIEKNTIQIGIGIIAFLSFVLLYLFVERSHMPDRIIITGDEEKTVEIKSETFDDYHKKMQKVMVEKNEKDDTEKIVWQGILIAPKEEAEKKYKKDLLVVQDSQSWKDMDMKELIASQKIGIKRAILARNLQDLKHDDVEGRAAFAQKLKDDEELRKKFIDSKEKLEPFMEYSSKAFDKKTEDFKKFVAAANPVTNIMKNKSITGDGLKEGEKIEIIGAVNGAMNMANNYNMKDKLNEIIDKVVSIFHHPVITLILSIGLFYLAASQYKTRIEFIYNTVRSILTFVRSLLFQKDTVSSLIENLKNWLGGIIVVLWAALTASSQDVNQEDGDETLPPLLKLITPHNGYMTCFVAGIFTLFVAYVFIRSFRLDTRLQEFLPLTITAFGVLYLALIWWYKDENGNQQNTTGTTYPSFKGLRWGGKLLEALFKALTKVISDTLTNKAPIIGEVMVLFVTVTGIFKNYSNAYILIRIYDHGCQTRSEMDKLASHQAFNDSPYGREIQNFLDSEDEISEVLAYPPAQYTISLWARGLWKAFTGFGYSDEDRYVQKMHNPKEAQKWKKAVVALYVAIEVAVQVDEEIQNKEKNDANYQATSSIINIKSQKEDTPSRPQIQLKGAYNLLDKQEADESKGKTTLLKNNVHIGSSSSIGIIVAPEKEGRKYLQTTAHSTLLAMHSGLATSEESTANLPNRIFYIGGEDNWENHKRLMEAYMYAEQNHHKKVLIFACNAYDGIGDEHAMFLYAYCKAVQKLPNTTLLATTTSTKIYSYLNHDHFQCLTAIYDEDHKPTGVIEHGTHRNTMVTQYLIENKTHKDIRDIFIKEVEKDNELITKSDARGLRNEYAYNILIILLLCALFFFLLYLYLKRFSETNRPRRRRKGT